MTSPRLLLLLVSLGGLAACLDVPEGPRPECESTADCRAAHGEVCEEGVCWGDPPEGTFAAVVTPPSERGDLVPKEITQLVMTQAGWIHGLQLEKPATMAGKVEADCTGITPCDRSVAATITVTRASQFQGGPGFKTVVTTVPSSADGASFELKVPRTKDGDSAYIVTIVPSGRDAEPPANGASTSAQQVPPHRLELEVRGDKTHPPIILGGQHLPVITGIVQSAGGAGLAQYRVVALGRWEAGSPLTEVSTVDYTDGDGGFKLVLAEDLVGDVEIVARPYGAVVAPTLRLDKIPSDRSSSLALVQPALLGGMTEVTIPVRGKVGTGEVAPVSGARVKVTARIEPDLSGTAATFTAEGTTNDAGEVQLQLLDGPVISGLYKLDVVPPASSNVGVIHQLGLDELGAALANPGGLILPARVPIRGVVVDSTGAPLKDVAVTARPSLRFLWDLEGDPQAFLNAVPASTTVTPATGEFVVWVDPQLAGAWGLYDLQLEPPMSTKYPTRAPTWVEREIAIPGMEGPAPREVWLPDAAFVHGQVTDPANNAVEGAEVKIFRIETSLALCNDVRYEPSSCPIPAGLLGRGGSDLGGLVRVTLPR